MRVAQAGDVPGRVRGARYLSGSGWKEYRENGGSSRIELPAGLIESDRAAGADLHAGRPRAEIGDHDENVDFERRPRMVGDRALMEELRRISIEVYRRRRARRRARRHPRRHKFELGRHAGARSSSPTRC